MAHQVFLWRAIAALVLQVEYTSERPETWMNYCLSGDDCNGMSINPYFFIFL